MLAPWADALYGIDRGWWIANEGAPEFAGLKFCPSPSVCKVFALREVTLRQRAEILIGEIGVIGCGLKTGGGHSGFQAINLAVQFGATRVALIGFDMTLERGAHWHGDYHGVSKPDAKRVETWRESLDACAPQFEMLGVEVLNASRESALRAYRKVDLNELAHLLSVSAAAYRGHSVGGVRDRVAGEMDFRH
jgi:hypothetical protein